MVLLCIRYLPTNLTEGLTRQNQHALGGFLSEPTLWMLEVAMFVLIHLWQFALLWKGPIAHHVVLLLWREIALPFLSANNYSMITGSSSRTSRFWSWKCRAGKVLFTLESICNEVSFHTFTKVTATGCQNRLVFPPSEQQLGQVCLSVGTMKENTV